jgi:hypothetical protein
MVEDIRDKTNRSLPLLWDKWKSAITKYVLYGGIKTRIQVDKQTESEEKLYLYAELIIFPKDDPELLRENRKLAEAMTKAGKKVVVVELKKPRIAKPHLAVVNA